MKIIEDVAQKANKHENKREYFSKNGIECVRVPLPVGDYILSNEKVEDVIQRKEKRGIPVKKMDLLGTYDICVDTKCSCRELYSDLIQQHARFHDEVHLAMNNGIKLIILTENKDGITDVESFKDWKNPQMFRYYRAKKKAEQAGEKPPKPPASNVQLVKIMNSMTRDYGVEFLFCKPNESGAEVIRLLTGENMGIFKDSINFGLEETIAFLIKLGFEYGKRSGAQGETGYTKIIHHNENETLWVTVDLISKEVHIYNEWDCGGKLWQKTLSIPQSILNSEEEFINWLDEQIGED